MTKKELIEIIQKAVALEVKKQINELLNTDSPKPVINKQTNLESVLPQKIVQKKEQKTFSKNPLLNEVLNKTVPFSPTERGQEEMLLESAVANSAVPMTDVRGAQINPESVPEEITNILTKDYSKLLKKSNEIAERNHRNSR